MVHASRKKSVPPKHDIVILYSFLKNLISKYTILKQYRYLRCHRRHITNIIVTSLYVGNTTLPAQEMIFQGVHFFKHLWLKLSLFCGNGNLSLQNGHLHVQMLRNNLGGKMSFPILRMRITETHTTSEKSKHRHLNLNYTDKWQE